MISLIDVAVPVDKHISAKRKRNKKYQSTPGGLNTFWNLKDFGSLNVYLLQKIALLETAMYLSAKNSTALMMWVAS